ncbi:MAG: hypothetical protein P8P29_08675 [Flavobacteriaceae bacterium]|nr:hypothetical protein [Flavobacteriaceae bacterium]
MLDRGEIQLDFGVEYLGPVTLNIGYICNCIEGGDSDLEIRYVRSESGQAVETLFDEEAIYNECWEALEL